MRKLLMTSVALALPLAFVAGAPSYGAESGSTAKTPETKSTPAESKPAESKETKKEPAKTDAKEAGKEAEKKAATETKESKEPMAGAVTLKEALADKILGDPNAPITILAFESMTCPHCATFHRNTLPQLKKAYIDTGKAKLVYIDFPLDGRARLASMLARCTGNDRFFPVIELLYASQQQWATRPGVQELMGELGRIGRFGGLNEAQFQNCMNNRALHDGIVSRQAEADKKYQIRSTPTFVINGQKVLGAQPFEVFDKVMKPLVK